MKTIIICLHQTKLNIIATDSPRLVDVLIVFHVKLFNFHFPLTTRLVMPYTGLLKKVHSWKIALKI